MTRVLLRTPVAFAKTDPMQKSGYFYFRGDQFKNFEMTGPDTVDFIHRISSVDVKSMEFGESREGFFLNAQGKIRSAFVATLWEKNKMSFEVSSEGASSFVQVIEELKFAEKTNLSVVQEHSLCLWLKSDAVQKIEGLEALKGSAKEVYVLSHFKEPEELNFDQEACSFLRFHFFGSQGGIHELAKNLEADFVLLGPDQYLNFRIQNHVCAWGHEYEPQFSPLDLGQIQGLSDQKGCYPGQEVIERILSGGSPSKKLVTIEGQWADSHIIQPKSEVLDAQGQSIGQVTSFLGDQYQGRFACLAVIKKILALQGLEVRIGKSSGTIKSVKNYVLKDRS